MNLLPMADTPDYFELFALPRQFSLDIAALDKSYFQAQQEVHPDRMARESDEVKRRALDKSMTLNQAYETLKSPLKRAEYLLALEGMKVNAEQGGITPSQSLLMEILALREELEEATVFEDIKTQERRAQVAIKQAEQDFNTSYTQQAFDTAAQHAMRLRYLVKLSEEAKLKRMRLA